MATRNAATSNFADVNNAVNGVGTGPYSTPAVEGDKVIVPNQPATWPQGLVVNKNIFLDFQGADITVPGGTAITLNTTARAVATFPPLPRLSDIKLHTTNKGNAIQVFGQSKSVRIDNVEFCATSAGTTQWARTLITSGSALGVIDHCYWRKEVNNGETLTMNCPSFGGLGTKGDNSWAVACNYGDANAWYFEDCIFANATYGADGQQGGRTVYRHCLNSCSQQNHGTESGGNRGARNTDWYNNISFFNFPNYISGTSFSDAYASRSGTGVAFNNIISGFTRLFNGGVAYRMEENYPVWGIADGANLLDLNATGTINDFNNDTMVPVASGGGGGRGDIYAQGSTSGPQNVTAVYGGTRTFPVTAPAVNCFKGMSIRNVTNTSQHNPAGRITGNTAGVGSCQITYASSNLPGNVQEPVLFANSDNWEIRKVIALKDMVGRGQDDAYSTTGTTPSPQRWMNQPADGVWCWNNLFRTGRTGAFAKVQQGAGLLPANSKYTEQIQWGRELHATQPSEGRYHYDTTAGDSDPGRRVGPDWSPDMSWPQSFFMTDADADGLGHSASSFGLGATGVGGYTYPHPLTLDTSTPTITNGTRTTFQVGVPGSFQFTTTGFNGSITWSKTGSLPSGVSLHPGTGVLDGTPDAGTAGSYPISVMATAGSQSDTQAFILTVQAAATKVIGLSGSLAFGTVLINTSPTRTFTVANTGNTDLAVSGITGPGGYTMDWTHGTIPPGASQDVHVDFAPLSSISYNGTITVASDKTSGTNTIAVSGVGGDRVVANSGNLSFGSVTTGQTSTRQLTVSNTGNMALTVTGVTYPTGFTGDYAGGSIAAGGSVVIHIVFAPTLAQVYSGTVTIATNSTSGDNTSDVTGTGVATPTKIIDLSGVPIDFTDIQTSSTADKNFTVTNNGTANLAITDVTVPSGYSADHNTATVTPGSSEVFVLTFAPLLVQTYSGTVTVVSDKTAGANTFNVTGNGVAPATKIISLSILEAGGESFGDVVIGTTSTKTLQITNLGSVPLAVSSITYPSGFTGAYSGSIAPGASDTVSILFTPTLVQAYGGTMTVASDKTSGLNTMVLSGNGVAPATRIIALSGNLAFGNVVKGHTVQRQLLITNSGTDVLSISSISLPTGFTIDHSSEDLSPGVSDIFVVTFAPVAHLTYGGSITVTSNKTAGGNTINCSGTGVNKKQAPFFIQVG